MSRTKLVPLLLLLLGSAVVVVVLVSTMVNFREPDPQPNISLIEVEVSWDLRGSCRLGDLPPDILFLDADVQFKLVNSGQADGFAVVEMTVRDVVVDSNSYFVRADETQLQILSFENLSCSLTPEQIDVRVAMVEGP